jgi:hypothetical protein
MFANWPLWRRLLFRFFFIYLALSMAPWTWLDKIPGVSFVTQYFSIAMDWAVNLSNKWIFHVRPELVPINGSGDTSFGWAQLWLHLSLAFAGMMIWSIFQRHKKEYTKLNYWLCLFTRYYVCMILFVYGIIKILGLQMSFPSYSQLATPLGDYLPMRFSWLFIGYSMPYQFFSGLMEVLAGLLLLYRRTATLGVLLATGVFVNVAALNLSYDIPVKIFSIQMVVCCLFLLANEMERILCFFVYNRPASACTIYHYSFPKKWMRITRVCLKILFIGLAVGAVLYDSITWYQQSKTGTANMVFRPGLYDVTHYVINGDTVPPLLTDTLRWQNVVFDNNRSGSIATRDTSFNKLYHRAYFRYKTDTVQQVLNIFRSGADTASIALLKYSFPDSNTIALHGRRRTDSFYLLLHRSRHNFQLAEKQFHWLSESNR